MSKEIDYRVVEMRFDNKEFEKNAKQTIDTLGKVKESLNFTESAKALDNLGEAAKNIKLDGIAASVEFLENRFSTLGIVGMKTISNLYDGLVNTLGKGISFINDSIVSGGIKRAMNIENAHFQLQALLKDEEKVQAVMADAMESVDGTAYAYDEAAKAASQFAASGIEAGEDMLNALKGITGVAAMTNSDFESIARIFTTVAGNGRIMGDQLLQLSSRGMNAASTIAEYFREVRGEVNTTEADIRKIISSKNASISFKEFSDAMTWAFGDSAKRANETFNGALSNMKSALARIGAGFVSPLIEQNGELVKLFNSLRIQINNVKSTLVFDEQKSAISGLAKATGTTTDEMKDLFSVIKTNGYVTIEDLDSLSDSGVNAYESLTKYINGVVSGTTRATYSTKKSLDEMTQGMEISEDELRSFVEEGSINLATFTSAMEGAYGDQKLLSKQFTDFFLDNIKGIINFVENIDITSMMERFYYVVEIVKNIFKGLGSVIKPAVTSIFDAFSVFTDESIISVFSKFEEITSKMKLTEKGSKNLHDTIKGLLDVILLLVDPLFKIFGITSNILNPIGSLLELILSVTGAIGRALSNFAKLIRYIKPLNAIFKGISVGFKFITDTFSFIINAIDKFITKVTDMEEISKVLNKVEKSFKNFGDFISPYIDFSIKKVKEFKDYTIDAFSKLGNALSPYTNAALKKVKEFKDYLVDIFSKLGNALFPYISIINNKINDFKEYILSIPLPTVNELLRAFNKEFTNTIGKLKAIDLSKPIKTIQSFATKIKEFFKMVIDGRAINIFVENIKKFSESIKSYLTFKTDNTVLSSLSKLLVNFVDLAVDAINLFINVMDKFISWIRDSLIPAIKDLSITDIGKIIVGVGIFYELKKIATAIKNFSITLSAIPNLLKGVNGVLKNFSGVLKSYQNELNASALIKISGAIGILAASIVLLSFTDMKKALEATLLLSAIGAALLYASSKFLNAISNWKTVNNSLSTIASGIKKSLNKFARAAEIQAIGTTILMITASIVAISVMYNKNPTAMKQALNVVEEISIFLGSVIVIMSILGTKLNTGMNGFSKAATGVLALSAALIIIIEAINKIFKLKLPNDYPKRLEILQKIIVELSALTVVMGLASRLAGTGKLSASSFISVGGLLYIIVSTLNKLFKIELPSDYSKKLKIFYEIIASLAAIILAIGVAAGISGGALKAGGTILALAVFLGVVVGSLKVLTDIPADSMQKGANALSTILLALAIALSQAGKESSEEGWKTVAAMVAMVVAIAGSLYVLSDIPVGKLATPAAAIFAILLSIGYAFKQLSNISDENAYNSALIMSLMLSEILLSLQILSDKPWSGLLAAGVSISAVLLSFSKAFNVLSESRTIKKDKLKSILAASSLLIIVAGSLAIVAFQPWDSLLSAGVSMSLVLYSFTNMLTVISSRTGFKMDKIKVILAATAVLAPIVAALSLLALHPWDSMLAGGISLSLTLLAFTECLKILSSSGINNIEPISMFMIAISMMTPIVAALSILSLSPWENLLASAASLSLVLVTMSGVLVLLTKMHVNQAAAIEGALALSEFVGILSAVIVALGALFSQDIIPLESWLDKGIEILAKVGSGLGQFAGSIVKGFGEAIASSLPFVGTCLSSFWTNASTFIDGISSMGVEVAEKMALLAGALVAFTVAELITGIPAIFGGGQLVAVGVELGAFIKAAQPFFDALSNIDSGTIESAKLVADMILAFAVADVINGIAKLLNIKSGGLAKFGEELSGLGEPLKNFADKVGDINSESVQGAAAAVEIMANAAKKLPNMSDESLMGKIFGKKSLADFGKELTSFGDSIVPFAQKMKESGINEESVKGVAAACDIMSACANNLPSMGGLQEKIFGSKSMAQFGSELVSYGGYMVSFSEKVKDLNPETINAVAAMTGTMTALANEIPDSGGIISWIKGDNDIGSFGKKLESFGGSFGKFYENIKDLDAVKISAAITEMNRLADLANTLKDVNTNSFKTFITSLNEVGNNGLKSFTDAFENSTEQINKAINVMYMDLGNAMSGKNPNITVEGLNSAKAWINGFSSDRSNSDASAAGATLVGKALDAIKEKVNDFLVNGLTSAAQYIAGIKKKLHDALEAGTLLAENALAGSGVSSIIEGFYKAGENAAQGFIDGLISKIADAKWAGEELAKASLTGTETTLDERSPSKEMWHIGDFAGLGFVGGLLSTISKSTDAGEKVADSALYAMNEAIRNINDIGFSDINPEIKPVVDLSNVRQSVNDITSMFNGAIATTRLNVSATNGIMSNSSGNSSNSNNSKNYKVENNYNFVQNNTSPKALSRYDIYRDTQNQIAQFKEAMND